MFYIGLFLIYVGLIPLSQYVDDLFFYMGDPFFADVLHYNVEELITAAILLIPAVILIFIGWNRPHKKHKFTTGLGIFLMLIGFLMLLDDDLEFHSFYYITFLGRFLVGLSVFLPGLLMFIRNKGVVYKVKSPVMEQAGPEVRPTEIKDIVPADPVDQTVKILKFVLNSPTTQNNQEFSKEISTTIGLLSEIKNEDFEIDEDFLNHIQALSRLFLEVEDNRIQTEKSKKTLVQIEETFTTINEALENIYDRNFDKKADLIEEEILTIKTKLNLKGELDTPFEKLKSKKA